jgi:hypothetical protein
MGMGDLSKVKSLPFSERWLLRIGFSQLAPAAVKVSALLK